MVGGHGCINPSKFRVQAGPKWELTIDINPSNLRVTDGTRTMKHHGWTNEEELNCGGVSSSLSLAIQQGLAHPSYCFWGAMELS